MNRPPLELGEMYSVLTKSGHTFLGRVTNIMLAKCGRGYLIVSDSMNHAVCECAIRSAERYVPELPNATSRIKKGVNDG